MTETVVPLKKSDDFVEPSFQGMNIPPIAAMTIVIDKRGVAWRIDPQSNTIRLCQVAN